jgi:uncharacterized phage-associated protein
MKMSVHIKHFDRDKALEVIVFIAKHLEYPTLHSVSKMLYLADKIHLQDYGRLICGDKYIAMEYGPVPSAIYNMMKVAGKRSTIDVDCDEIILEAIEVINDRSVKARRDCNMDMLSESEVECLKKTIDEYGSKTFGQLTDITHDEAWNSAFQNNTISIEAIAMTLPNASEILNYIHAH